MRNNFYSIVLVALIAAGCSSSEDVELFKEAGPGRPPLPEPSIGSAPSAWSDSDEYWDSNGLPLIRAAEGYAARTTGQAGGAGRSVAVLDEIVDVDHPDLAGKAFKFTEDEPDIGNPNNNSHGTHVAGTIAARRDGVGMHGVAYNADIVGIAVLRTLPRQPVGFIPEISSPTEVAAAIASAAGIEREYQVYDVNGQPVLDTFFRPVTSKSDPSASAHIMNMSFKGPDPFEQVLDAMQDAAGQGRIMVAALGNDAVVGPSDAPAKYMASPGVAGWGIAVGALNESGTGRASFSNSCGQVAEYCLFAPGSNVYSTIEGGGYGSKSGTSMASPHVAGAAAVVWAAFPNKSGSDIVTRLLETADSLDGVEISSMFGHGALNLEAAMQPSDFLSLSVPGAGFVPLHSSFVDLPPGFGANTEGLGFANAIVYDTMDFPFRYDLNSLFRTRETESMDHLRSWLTSIGPESSAIPIGESSVVQFIHDDGRSAIGSADDVFGSINAFDSIGSLHSREGGEQVHGFRAQFQPSSDMSFMVSNLGSPTGATNRRASSRMDVLPVRDELSIGPYAALTGHGVGMNVEWRLGEDTTVDASGKDGDGYFGSEDAKLASIGLTRRTGERLTFGARVGTIRERGSRVGVRADGAFEGISGATTNFVDLGAEAQLSQDAVLFGSVTRGVTEGGAPDRTSLVRNWSDVRASSAIVGAEFGNLLRASDRLVVAASMPFRVDDGSISVDVPNEEIADMVTTFATQDVSLEPTGREKKLQVVYETDLSPRVAGALGAFVRVEPNHDAAADNDVGLGGKIRVAF